MDLKRIHDGLAVAPQIAVADLPEIARAGYRAVICNRPDGEAADQPTFAEIAAAARTAGLKVLYQPVMPGQVTEADADAFRAALCDLPGPVLAYCRSGTRSETLWSRAMAAEK